MKQYLLTALAKQDIEDITSYVADENKGAALKLLNNIYDAMGMLVDHPMIGHIREDLTDKNVRFWTVKPHYLIVYEYISSVKIIRVLSGYRDITQLL